MKNKCNNSYKCFNFNKVKDFKYIDEVCLANNCFKVDYILEVSCCVEIIETKVIEICSEYYLIVKGIKILKVFYEASNLCTCGKVLSKKFVVPFFEKIKIKCGSKIENVEGHVSYCDFDNCGLEHIFINTIITICIEGIKKCEEPTICFEEKEDICKEKWHLNNDCIKY